jgi:hypothetical protein
MTPSTINIEEAEREFSGALTDLCSGLELFGVLLNVYARTIIETRRRALLVPMRLHGTEKIAF